MMNMIKEGLENNGLITAFAIIGIVMYIAYFLSDKLTKGRVHGSAIAIMFGLILAYIGGVNTGGEKGISDIQLFSGIGLMGGGMLRDFAIIATAFGASFSEVKNGNQRDYGLVFGVFYSFVIGVIIALCFGYRDPIALTTIGGGAVTYIVGPVSGTAIGASSDIIALSIAVGLIKSISVMILTPIFAKKIKLNNPRTAMIYGGVMGTTSGVAAGLAATDVKLVPYGAMTATFYTGLGCLLVPSILFYSQRLFLSVQSVL
ncbi:malonate transporter subunit MadM [Priestia megaterium]